MRFALPALRVLGALGLGLGLGISSIQVAGVIKTDPVGLLVPIVIYALIGGAVLVVASPRSRQRRPHRLLGGELPIVGRRAPGVGLANDARLR